MISVLTIVGFISGATLVLVFRYANPLILDNQKRETREAVFKIFPDGKTYDKKVIGEDTFFKVRDKTGKLLGYTFLASGNGYQGEIDLMAGIKPDMKTLVGIEVLQSQETPGLGQEIDSKEFKEQFKNLAATPEITYVKNQKPSRPNEIEAITGATISSRAVVTILNEKIEDIRSKLK